MKKNRIGIVMLLEAAVMLAVFIFVLVVTEGDRWAYASVAYFFDLTAIVSILLFTVPVLLVSGTMKDFKNAFLLGKEPFTLAQGKRALEAVKMMQQFVLCGCFLISVINFVVMLYNMEDINTLGPCMATMSLSFFYTIILEMLLIPLKAHVQNWLTDMMDVIDEEN